MCKSPQQNGSFFFPTMVVKHHLWQLAQLCETDLYVNVLSHKRNLSEVFTMAQLPGEGWKHFQTLNDLFEKAALKRQTAKPTDIFKKGKPVLRQWQLKPLCKLSSKDQTFLLGKVGLACLACLACSTTI